MRWARLLERRAPIVAAAEEMEKFAAAELELAHQASVRKAPGRISVEMSAAIPAASPSPSQANA